MSGLSRVCFLFLVMLLTFIGVPKANAANPETTDQKVNVIEDDVLQGTGQKIEFGSHQDVTIQPLS